MKSISKVTYCFVVLFIVVVLVCIYNDGRIPYNIQKVSTPPISLIEYYTGIKFPDGTKVNNIDYIHSINHEDTFYDGEDHIEATLLIPSNKIDNIFPENGRDYEHKSANCPVYVDDKSIDFSYKKYNAVRRWGYKTQRTISFCIMESNNNVTPVHINIGTLGWYLWDKWKLGGMD